MKKILILVALAPAAWYSYSVSGYEKISEISLEFGLPAFLFGLFLSAVLSVFVFEKRDLQRIEDSLAFKHALDRIERERSAQEAKFQIVTEKISQEESEIAKKMADVEKRAKRISNIEEAEKMVVELEYRNLELDNREEKIGDLELRLSQMQGAVSKAKDTANRWKTRALNLSRWIEENHGYESLKKAKKNWSKFVQK